MKYKSVITVFYKKEGSMFNRVNRMTGSKTRILDEIAMIMKEGNFENIQVAIKAERP